MKCLLTWILLFSFTASYSQDFNRQDTLRGSITAERAWWDLVFYDLNLQVHPDKKFIEGENTIKYKVIAPSKVMQIDLQEPMIISEARQNGKRLKFTREGNAYFIKVRKRQKIGSINEVQVKFSGHPREAIKAPWDGGISWMKDDKGNHFIASSCQGLGASVWWPNKDHMYDEVDSMAIRVRVPDPLKNISNGRLRSINNNTDGTSTYNWFVSNPINNYGVNINIGNYVNFREKYQGEKGTLDLDFWVLKDHLEIAKEHFKDASGTISAFEYWFGPYPFYEDSYKLVEVPYLGMEHQSSVTYGNEYKLGYQGRDLSGTGWGLLWDYIIIHESGHEWFANNITYKDIADMWIHESFTTYSESLFVEYYYGKNAGAEYVIGMRKNIKNDIPIIGVYDVNKSGSKDMYFKGSNILHTLRQLIEDDQKWRSILRGLNRDFYHQTVTTKQIENYLSEKTGIDLQTFFDQYLRDHRIPKIEYKFAGDRLRIRYVDVVSGFDMPVKVFIGSESQWISPKEIWTEIPYINQLEELVPDPNFYVFWKDTSQ